MPEKAAPAQPDPLLVVDGLIKHYPAWRKRLFDKKPPIMQAVNGVSFEVRRGETFGLVGESGCGKSTTAQCILRIQEPTGGQILFDGMDVGALSPPALRRIRRRMQLVLQDPVSALDPRMPAIMSLMEPLRVHREGDRMSQRRRVHQLLDRVGIHPEEATRYPHELSGGQCQRIAIARALMLEPDLLILDEAVSALDVSVRAELLNLLSELQREFDLTYLFIAHDLAVVRQICDRIAVMYLGQIVETGTRKQVFSEPLHPYTQALLSAIPLPDPELEALRERIVLPGDVPSPSDPPPGCRFHPRCPVGKEETRCRTEEPELTEHASGHPCACHFPGVRITVPSGQPR